MDDNPAGVVALATVFLAAVNVAFLWINAHATRKHELRMLRETRVQQRLETTYREFVTFMHHSAATADHLLDQRTLAPGDMISSREVSEAVGPIKSSGAT